MPDDKFIQPADAIEVERRTGVGTLLSQDVLRDARRRITAGEDREKVILELAFMQVELEEGMREDGLLPPEEEGIRTLFDPDQERDEQGRWTDGGGSKGALDLGKSGWKRDKTDIVRRRAETIARDLGVPPAIINVVDKEPRAFQVGDQQFREAGHYDPKTGMIEINARVSYDDRMSVTNGIAAHEVSHAIYDAARLAQTAEHDEIAHLSDEESKRLFSASGYVRPERQTEVHERWPVSAMFYRHIGDSYMETEEDQKGISYFRKNIDQLAKDDGVSEYSKSYWQSEALKLSGGMDRAVNETLAEMTRHQIAYGVTAQTASINEAGQEFKLAHTWKVFAEDLRKIASHPKVKARLGRRS